MLRALVVACLLLAPADASAGERCRRQPDVVFFDAAADVHEDRKWHRTKKGKETSGRLTYDAYQRFLAFLRTGAKPAKVVKCLDALIDDERSRAAKKACRVKAPA